MLAPRRSTTLLATSTFAVCVLAAAACAPGDDAEDLGDVGDGKSDTAGITSKPFTVSPGDSREFSFTSAGPFVVRVSQPNLGPESRQPVRIEVSADGMEPAAAADAEPSLSVTPPEGEHAFRLVISNDGDVKLKGVLDVVPTAGLPDPNAAEPPPEEWQPPALETWPATYVVFNNTGCGHDCTTEDSAALKARSVMAKMAIAAIHNVRQGGVIRVANFNISSSSTVKPVADALLWAMTERGATVRIVMDPGQNTPESRTSLFAQQGAAVRFTGGMTYTSEQDPDVPKVGIFHSKMLIVDDQVLLTGSNNFSFTGFVTNEENSVVMRAPEHADRIAAFTCDFERAFEAGVEAGAEQRPDDEQARADAIAGVEGCNLDDVWFPPGGGQENRAPAYDALRDAIWRARSSVYLAPDMLAHPGLVSAIVRKARKVRDGGGNFTVRLVMDGSSEALGNPAFAECLADAAAAEGLDIEVRYWPGTEEIFQLLHHKFLLTDAEDPFRATLYNGSANFSAKALKWSFENVTRYDGAEFSTVVAAFRVRFHKLFDMGLTREQMAAEGIEVPACPLDASAL